LTTTSSPSPILDLRRSQLEKLLQITSHNFEVRVGFGKRDSLADEEVVLGIPDLEVDYRVVKGKALRLLGHYLTDARATELQAQALQRAGAPWFVRLWHALEDARVENWMLRRWPGMAKSFEAKLPPKLGGSLMLKASLPRQLEFGLYLTGRGIRGAQLDPLVREALRDVEGMAGQGAAAESPQDSLAALQGIYPRLKPLLVHSRREMGSADEEPPRRAARQVPQPENAARETEAENAAPGLPEIELEDGLVWARPLGRPRQMPEWYRPGSAPWFEAGLGEKQIHPSAMRSDRQTIMLPTRGDPVAYRSLWLEVQHEAGFLISRLVRLLQEEAYLRYAGRFRSGQLVMNRLWKQRLADYRLFQRQEAGGRRSTAVSLLVDESASMQGREKSRLAAKAAILLGETLSRLQVPLEIIGYTTAGFEAREAMRLGLTPAYQYRTMRCSPLQHRLYKSFGDSYRQVRSRLSDIQPRHNNWDEEHLLFAYRRIRSRPEPGKLILVIGDGQPNGDADHLARAAAAVERLGCKVIGVGIGEDFVRRIYRNAIVVSDFHQLGEALLGILAREIGRGVPAYAPVPTGGGVPARSSAPASPQ